MTVGRKLLGGFGVMLGLVLLLSAAALVALRNLNDDLDRAAKVTARKQYLAGGVNAGASEMASLARGSVLASVVGDKAHSDAYQEQFRQPQDRIAERVGRTAAILGERNRGRSYCSGWSNRHHWCGRRNRSCGRPWPTSNWIRRW